MSDSTLMKMLGTQMRYQSQRQGVLAQNIANADTPGYKTRDLKKMSFEQLAASSSTGSGASAMRTTSPKHLQGTISGANAFAAQSDREFTEVTPVGNNVVLEEQMAKISDTGAQFNVASSMVRKFTGMYRAALGNR